MRLMAPTLLDFCYLNVASILASAPLAVCSECGRVFVVGDKRQKFCEPKCAGRSRFRNYLARVGQRRAGGVDLCSRVLIEGAQSDDLVCAERCARSSIGGKAAELPHLSLSLLDGS